MTVIGRDVNAEVRYGAYIPGNAEMSLLMNVGEKQQHVGQWGIFAYIGVT
jgi:hypothetical protein